ncbi:MAG: ATP-binding cassette domain-containing protein [Acidimicrobiales bacterium]
MSYTVNATGICKSFGKQVVLDQVDLAIEKGAVLALLGPNGAGKTTMVRILSTLVRPDAGAATICGHDLLTDPFRVKESISLTGQYAAVDDLLTGEENIEMAARLKHLRRGAARLRTSELLSDFDLQDARHKRASTYSGGMRRRLDLAMSMVVQPQLLFLDEPTTGLDPHSREQVWNTVTQLTSQGVTILLTTQYLEEADRLADEIMLLDKGRVVARGTAEELKSTLGTEVLRVEFADQASFDKALRVIDTIRFDAHLQVIEVATNGSAGDIFDTLGRLQSAGASASKVGIRSPSLDDVFLSLTGLDDRNDTKEVA